MVPLTKRKRPVLGEISFDAELRREYLTGFHKRKLARAKKAREEAEKAAKAERLEDRRRLRESRKQELSAHVAAVQEFSRKAALEAGDIETSSGEAEWDGISDSEDKEEDKNIRGVDGEDEYVDEEKYTIVTVEAMDLGEESEDEEASGERMRKREEREKEEERLMKKKEARQRNGPKEKKKKFRYLTKSERRQDRAKVKMGKAKRRKERESDKEGQRKGGKLGKGRKK